MGSGAGALLALAGIPTTLVARSRDKAEAGRARAIALSRGALARDAIALGTYDDPCAIGDADLVLEAVAEDRDVKREVLAMIDRARAPGAIVATVTSGLSIAALCADASDGLRRHFLGVHLFNPPTAIRGCELIPHRGTDPAVVARVRELLETTLGRVVVACSDTPGFAGNRIGFKLLNEVAQLAEQHGVAYMDQLLGTHTGRALPPLATIDLVGWDVHQAICDHLWHSTCDEGHASFALPPYVRQGIARGHLGRKTRDRGGFYRVEGDRRLVLDPATGGYQPLELAPLPPLVERMAAAVRSGRHGDALDALCTADGHDAEVLRGVVLGHISYAFGRVGEVVDHARDIDRIMAAGFHWAPPGMLVDAIGAPRVVRMLERGGWAVPPVLDVAARAGLRLHDGDAEPARFFVAA